MRHCFVFVLFILSFNTYGSDTGGQSKRIIALAPHIVENLFAIGAGELIVGATEYADYPEQAKKIPVVGGYASINAEAILALAPDVIIVWRTGNHGGDLARLEKLNIPLVYSNPVELEDVASELVMLGELTGKTAQANRVAENYLNTLTQLREQYSHAAPITIFYELWPKPLTTIANNAWPLKAVSVCGGKSIFETVPGDYPKVSLEQIVLKKPEVIIVPVSDNEIPPPQTHWKNWPSIPAVAKQQIVTLNSDKAHRTTLRVLEEIQVLCERLDLIRNLPKAALAQSSS